ncbi:hypothetical protein [Pseudomonas virus PBPA162]|uniref:Zinc finger domain protein n=2 Tax=Iggyvirus TaxID=3044738 RepID=A0A7S5AYX3_9CAUD|nr:zinc finger domain protein [Pseudomonas phage Iggy]YP_010671836.1 hypothetical protein PQC32_gp73 [Pseudomonas virus PBPA162]QDB70907.1 hypothetical protein [Pseudomonas virus PBPA162]QEA09786.1 zinc finger domain protein [Pseudomonas phage Iggy]
MSLHPLLQSMFGVRDGRELVHSTAPQAASKAPGAAVAATRNQPPTQGKIGPAPWDKQPVPKAGMEPYEFTKNHKGVKLVIDNPGASAPITEAYISHVKIVAADKGFAKPTDPSYKWDVLWALPVIGYVSFEAIANVKDCVPPPSVCPCCGHNEVTLIDNSEVYGGVTYGQWPYIYYCSKCEARVGLHRFTHLALGYMADAETRELRKFAKSGFLHWKGSKSWTTNQAYSQLANKLDIPREQCHFGMFDAGMCRKVISMWPELGLPKSYWMK